MAKSLRPRRGSSAQHAVFVGDAGELTIDTSRHSVVVHDGVTPGGFDLKRELAGGTGSEVGYQATTEAPKRNIYLKLTATKSIKDFSISDEVGDGTGKRLADYFTTLEQAQVQYPLAVSLNDTLDWVVTQTAVRYLINQNKAAFLECDQGDYKFNRSLLLNPTLDCSTPVQRFGLIGDHLHRAYDSGNDMPCSMSATTDFSGIPLIDFRAGRKLVIRGIGFYAPSTVSKILQIGSEACLNPRQMERVLTLEHSLFYGGQRNLDAYLVSGLVCRVNNFSRAANRGLNLNAVGDAEFTENLVNNCGPILTGGVGSDYYAGSGVIAYGGGGGNRWSGGKVEVCSKGLLLDNVHSWGIEGTTFDKCKEFALAVSGNLNTVGKTTNLGYQPRNIRITGCNFQSNGWDPTYQTHILLANSGTDLELSVTLTGNTFARGGQNAIPLDTTASGIFGVGPYRSIRANNSALGTSSIYVSSAANKYQGGSSDFSFQSYSPNVTFDSGGGDEFDKPVVAENGLRHGIRCDFTVTIEWSPGVIPAGGNVQSPVTPAQYLGFSDAIEAAAPASLQGLILQAYTTSNTNLVARLYNPTTSPITAPSGTYTFTYRVVKWILKS